MSDTPSQETVGLSIALALEWMTAEGFLNPYCSPFLNLAGMVGAAIIDFKSMKIVERVVREANVELGCPEWFVMDVLRFAGDLFVFRDAMNRHYGTGQP